MSRPVTYLTFTCAGCNRPFTRTKSQVKPGARTDHICCSSACARKIQLHPASRAVTLTCARCQVQFTRAPAEAAKYRTPYCSNACRRGPRARYTCVVCGREHITSPAHLRNGRRHCSRACADVAQRHKIPHICIWCGSNFAVPPSRAKLHCSRRCRFEHMRADPTQHSQFQGGFTPYYGPNWRRQRHLARERDAYVCQQCGKHQRRPALHVHHIRPLRAFDGDWAAANALDNLVTLCSPCHKRVEHAGWPIVTVSQRPNLLRNILLR